MILWTFKTQYSLSPLVYNLDPSAKYGSTSEAARDSKNKIYFWYTSHKIVKTKWIFFFPQIFCVIPFLSWMQSYLGMDKTSPSYLLLGPSNVTTMESQKNLVALYNWSWSWTFPIIILWKNSST